MGYALIDDQRGHDQFIQPRRGRITGQVGFHCNAALLDRVAPDMSAENTFGFILNDPAPHSYHEMCDSDSLIIMLPDNVEAFGAKGGYNRTLWHFCICGVPAEFKANDWATRIMVGQAAVQMVAFWRRNGFDPIECARFLTKAEVDAGKPGIVHHGTLQGDRSDAWAHNANRAELDALLISAIHDAAGSTPTTKVVGKMLASARNTDGRVERFRIRNGKVEHSWQQAPNGKFSPWRALGTHVVNGQKRNGSPGVVDQITAYQNADGRLEVEVFNASINGPIWRCAQDPKNVDKTGTGWRLWRQDP